MSGHKRTDDRPKGTEDLWSASDLAELWASIAGDACIEPDNWIAAFRAASQGDDEWWLAVDRTEGDSED
jgi:hypothetical protein